jgi:hypothetical protein
MTQRTDPHRPGAIVPQDYDLEFYFTSAVDPDGFSLDEDGLKQLADFEDRKLMVNIHGAFQCDICGAWYTWGAGFIHTPSGMIVTMGRDCAEKYQVAANMPGWERYKGMAIDKARARARRAEMRAKVREFAAAHPDVMVALKAIKGDYVGNDLRHNLMKWGSLTAPQIKYVFTLQARVARKAEWDAAEAEINWIDVPVSSKRVTVSGEVLTIKWQENDYGGSLKMLLRVDTDEGSYKLWGTVAAAIDPKRGDLVTFDARVERSRDDSKFGFYNRPTKASITGVNIEAVYEAAIYEDERIARAKLAQAEDEAYIEAGVRLQADIEEMKTVLRRERLEREAAV